MDNDSRPRFNPLTTTAEELQSLLATGKITTIQIVETYLEQIERHNHAGRKLNALISVVPKERLVKIAGDLDDERAAGKLRGELHGSVIVLKDCFQFHPDMGLKTTVGAYCFAAEKSKKTARVVEQLIEKGLIILGTATLSEFCGHKAEDMTPGWSAYGGQTRSAYDKSPPEDTAPKRGLASLCGGSSSGSAVAVSAGFSILSLGTQTGGSAVYPASKAGLYAIRPTLGTVSVDGVFRISKSFDGIGAMAKTPLDLSLLLEAILLPEKLPDSGFREELKKGWEGLRIGITESTWGTGAKEKWESQLVKSTYDNISKKIEGKGGHVLFPADVPDPSSLKHNGLSTKEIAYHEFNAVIREFCDGFENPKVKGARDIITFNEESKETAMPEPHPDQKELIISSNSQLNDDVVEEAWKEIRKLAGRNGMDKYMTERELDIIVAGSDSGLVSWCACSGYPSATVPLGNLEDGSPYGLFLLAREGREDLLFRFMGAWEDTFDQIKGPVL